MVKLINESIGANASIFGIKESHKSGIKEGGVSDIVSKMSRLGYRFNGMSGDTLDFDGIDGDTIKFYGWNEVEDFINDGTLPSDSFEKSFARYQSKNKRESIKRDSKRSIKEELDSSSYEDLKYEVYRATERAFNSFVRNNEMNVSDDEITSIMKEVTAKLLDSVVEI